MMTPAEMDRAERDAALIAGAHALTVEEREQFLAKTSRWRGMDGAGVADVLDLTVEHDEFLGQTETFYARLAPGALPAGPALIFALHALIILGRPLTVAAVKQLLVKAGITDDDSYDPTHD